MDGVSYVESPMVSILLQLYKDAEKSLMMTQIHSKIFVDIIMCGSNATAPAEWKDRGNAYSNFLRLKEIKSHNDNMADIYEFVQAYPEVNFRYFVAPTRSLGSSPLDMLNADNSTKTFPW